MDVSKQLEVVTYHYVRDLPKSRFPEIKGLQIERFIKQVEGLRQKYEMATLESALAFLDGKYEPKRDLCLLTFDDGLREHFTDVTPILAKHGIQGLFFVTTACPNGRMVSVHKNHVLMAGVKLSEYRKAFFSELEQSWEPRPPAVSGEEIRRAYPWDTEEIGAFKYLINYQLKAAVRDRILDKLFVTFFGDEEAFAKEWYLSWEEGRQMQEAGMLLGGHSHEHQPLGTLPLADLAKDLNTCAGLLKSNFARQELWPFCFPFGTPQSYSDATVNLLQDLGFACSFTTRPGTNGRGQDRFRILRTDTNQITV
jgi:peptidoglycan/xylan/chitin deacetylase (PgdA/CDA1 family)